MRIRKIVGATALACAAVVTLAAPAFAHVTINPSDAPKGSFAKLTFRVPNEMDNANSIKLDLKLPDDHPFPSLSVQPKDGWTYQAMNTPLPTPVTNDDGQQITEAVTEIVWSGGQIKPGEFDEFSISVGPLPDDVDSLTFPVIQSYDNGQDVSWIQQTVEGQPEPDHPAPVLTLTAATGDNASSASGSSSSGNGVSVSGTVIKNESNNALGIAALVVGAVALVIGIVALARGRGSRGAQT
jgi:uncharacterized protein YcnI